MFHGVKQIAGSSSVIYKLSHDLLKLADYVKVWSIKTLGRKLTTKGVNTKEQKMKTKQFVGMIAVMATAMAEQAFGSGRITSQVMPALAMATLTWVFIGVGCAILVGIGTYRAISGRQSRPGKTTLPPAKKSAGSAGNFFGRKPVPGPLATTGRSTEETVQEPSEQTAALSMANPTSASSTVGALAKQAQQGDHKAIEILISALGYCYWCQVGDGQKKSMPHEFVRLKAAKILGELPHGVFQDLDQIIRAIEAVSQETSRKGELGKIYSTGLEEVLLSLLGSLQASLTQLRAKEDGSAQIEAELSRYESADGSLKVDEEFAKSSIVYRLLKGRPLKLEEVTVET